MVCGIVGFELSVEVLDWLLFKMWFVLVSLDIVW